MNILTAVIIVFIFLETLNVIILYFFHDTKKGNGISVFKAYEKVKTDPEIYAFVRYLINWIAGTKLIFIALLIVILFTGNNTTKIFSTVALILTILSFYWRLYPALKKMDHGEQLNPKGYSKSLATMIAIIVAILLGAFVIHLI